MADLLAKCINPACMTFFTVSTLQFGNSSNLTLKGVKLCCCPNCQSYGIIPDGVYDFQNDILVSIVPIVESLDNLIRLQNKLRDLILKDAVRDVVIEEIQKISSKTSEAAKRLPISASTTDWIQVLLAIIGILIAIHLGYFKKEDVTEKKFQEHLIRENEWYREQIKQLNKPIPIGYPKNKPCPCGSGNLYKRCHGTI